MNIFLHELRRDRRSFFFWCLAMLALLAAMAAKTSGMVGDGADSLNAVMLMMPRVLQNLFGLGVADLSEPIGMISVVMQYVALILCFHAATLGSSTFAREERDRTFEFLYVRGRARPGILRAKVLAGTAQLVGINLFTFGACFAAVRLMGGAAGALAPMAAGMLVMQAVFYAAGLLASFLTRNMKLAGSVAAAAVMGMFLLAMFTDLAPGMEALGALTPFKAFDFKRMVAPGVSPTRAVLWLLVAAAMTGASFALHNRRDLNT